MKTSQSNRSIGQFSRSLALAAAVIAGLATVAGAQDVTIEQQQQQQQGGGRRNQFQQDQNNQDQQGGGRQRQFQQDPNNQDPNGGGGRRGRGGGGAGGGGFNGGGGFAGRQQQIAAMQTPSSDSFIQEYGDLSTHNIFMRDRRQPEPRPVVDRGPRAAEDLTVLVGIVKLDDGAYQAYIEDASKSQILKLVANAQVATGKILEITSTGIVYKGADKEPINVSVGANLNGVSSNVSNVRIGLRANEFNGFSRGENNIQPGARGNIGGAFGNNTGLAGGRGGRGGGFTNPTPTLTVAPPPLPGTEGMSIEERMRMRRSTEGMPSAAVPITAQPVAPAAPVVEAAPAPAPIVDPEIGGNLSIEEQMRLRRQLQQ